jgi:hypothetical protein
MGSFIQKRVSMSICEHEQDQSAADESDPYQRRRSHHLNLLVESVSEDSTGRNLPVALLGCTACPGVLERTAFQDVFFKPKGASYVSP